MTRTGISKELIEFPCSIFLTKQCGERFVLSIYKSTQTYIVKKWNIHQCDPDQALPPMEEFIVEDLFNDTQMVLPDTTILRFHHTSIPSSENATNRPMTEEKYHEYFNNYLESFVAHNNARERWLWYSFLSAYHPEIIRFGMSVKRTVGFFGSYAQKEIMQDQKMIVEIKHPKTWKYWSMWKKYMLDFKGPPGEFGFCTAYPTVL